MKNLINRKKRSIKPDDAVEEIENFAGGSAFFEFISKLRKFLGVSEKAADDLKLLLKDTKLGLSAPEDILKRLEVKKLNGIFMVGEDIPLNKLEYVLKEGNLKRLIEVTKVDAPILESDVKAFKTIVGDTSEKSLNELSELTTQYKKLYTKLDTTIEDFQKLSKSSKEQVAKIENNLFKYFKRGAIIALTIGTIYVADGWILKETEKRKGCFLVRREGNEVTSCKIINYSCNYYEGCECSDQSDGKYYNITLAAMSIAKLANDNETKIKVATAVGKTAAEFESSLPNILSTKFPELTQSINSLTSSPINLVDICKLTHAQIENGVIPPCRVCDPEANPISTTYVDSSQLPINFTFKCVTNPSILDVITDIFKTTGKNIFDIGSKASGAIKSLGILLAFILVMFTILSLVVKSFQKKNDNKNNFITLPPPYVN